MLANREWSFQKQAKDSFYILLLPEAQSSTKEDP